MHIPVNEKSKTQPGTPKSQINLKIHSEKVWNTDKKIERVPFEVDLPLRQTI